MPHFDAVMFGDHVIVADVTASLYLVMEGRGRESGKGEGSDSAHWEHFCRCSSFYFYTSGAKQVAQLMIGTKPKRSTPYLVYSPNQEDIIDATLTEMSL